MSKYIGILLAFLALASGILYYVLFRADNPPLFMPQALSHVGVMHISSLDFIPTFCHSLAFMLFTCSVFSNKKSSDLRYILSWVVLELLFEVLQLSQNTATFALDDVIAIFVAAILCRLIINHLRHLEYTK